MARKARIKSQTGIYHVLIRGNAHLDLFIDAEDTTYYVQLLQDLNARNLCRIFAYSLHPTHIHLLVQEGPNSSLLTPNSSLSEAPNSSLLTEPIGATMRRLASTYAYYYNVKYDHYGPIYQDRFKSQPVETRPFFMRVLDFILAQPVGSKATLLNTIPSLPETNSSLLTPHSSLDKVLDFVSRPQRITESRLLTYLQQQHAFSDVTEFLQRPTEEQNKIISDCKLQGGSVRQLARLTGIPYQRVFLAK